MVDKTSQRTTNPPATKCSTAGLETITASGLPAAFSATTAGQFITDTVQRSILFWDVMRRRSEDYFRHKAMQVPHVLQFNYELVMDGRQFDKPVNYMMVRVTPPEGVTIDPKKRPFVVVDPRAGHGPGIGGFKADSELGVAMRAGHTCYFVGFSPDPMPGQTIEDIMHAEASFLEKVLELHPGAEGKPCVIGNCQAGWAVMMLAAVRPELFGPIIIPGSPLSYWAGVKGRNPMRYLGGIAGGSWVTALLSDLGGGVFDGGNLVGNFEAANPSNTYWSKPYNVWAKVDTEAERYLGFETWWGGHVNLNAEEIQWIVDELFIGNHLSTAEIVTRDGVRVDLRNIKSPIICFCSEGDNITPPQQALGWITDLYQKDADIKACGQTIVYTVHEGVGHLGIFVSGGVARKEHAEFASNIDLIDVLPPGLYEAVLTRKDDATPGVQYVIGDWVARFEPRNLDDIRAIVQPDPGDDRMFAAVRHVSDINLGLYRLMARPFVQAMMSTPAARQLSEIKPAELPYLAFSDRNPLMRQIAEMAAAIRDQRVEADPDNPFVKMREMVSDHIVASLDMYRDLRDMTCEQIFLGIYGNPVMQALMGLRATDEPPRRRPGLEPEELAFIDRRLAEIKAKIAEGGVREAGLRGLLYIGMAGPGADERAFAVLREMRDKQAAEVTLETFKNLVREQYFALMLDEPAALDAIPRMLATGTPEQRAASLERLRKVVNAIGTPEGERAKRLAAVEKLYARAA